VQIVLFLSDEMQCIRVLPIPVFAVDNNNNKYKIDYLYSAETCAVVLSYNNSWQ
jgi:hypothetical protein